jgi:4,5-epoxidase
VRDLAGIGVPGVSPAERFLLVDAHADLPLSRESIHVWLDGASVLGAFPLPGRDLWRLMAPAADPGGEADLVADEVVLAEVIRLLRERTGCDPALIPEWITSFRVHRRLADSYRSGRILLAGDAAHVHSPFGGQGMDIGIGDAENLAWKLAMVVNRTAAPALLDSYEAERRPIAADVLRWTGGAANLVLGDHLLARVLRDRVIIPLMNRQSIQRRVWEAVRGRAREDPRPGDSVPDIECGPTTLHAELGNRWALVTPRMSEACVAVATKRLGDDGVTALVADVEDTMLVRPDAQLGWRGPADPDALDRWLITVTGRT